MFYWIKNKSDLEEEIEKEDEQYNKKLIEIKMLKDTIKNLENECEKEKKLKQIYLSRCKNLKRKLAEYEVKKA